MHQSLGVTMMSNMLSSNALILKWSLRRKFAPLFTQTGSHDVSTFLNQNNNKLPFSLHKLPINDLLFMSRLAVALLD